MSNTMRSLHRLRERARRASEMQLHEARVNADRQRQRLEAVHQAVAEAREQTDAGDVLSLTTWHAFRLRQEVVERRESARLAQRQREVDTAETQHAVRVRDELAIQSVIEEQRVRAAEEARYAEGRVLDEIGARMRWSA